LNLTLTPLVATPEEVKPIVAGAEDDPAEQLRQEGIVATYALNAKALHIDKWRSNRSQAHILQPKFRVENLEIRRLTTLNASNQSTGMIAICRINAALLRVWNSTV
jgi:hypothetical protein